MRIADLAAGAADALLANKLRSGLTTLGIVIGVGAVVAMMALTSGLEGSVEDQFSGLGSNVFQIQKWPAMHFGGAHHLSKYRKRKDITLANANAVREQNEAARYVGAELWTFGGVVRGKYGETRPSVVVAGGTPEFATNNGYGITEGRMLNSLEVDHERDVIVLGAEVAKKVFPNTSAVGNWVTLMSRRYQTVGVFEERGSFFGIGSRDNFVVIPISSFIRVFGKNRSVNITVQALFPELFDFSKDRAIQTMRRERLLKPDQENDFEIFSNESIIDAVSGLTTAITFAAIGIAMISLLVGGIGIMNIMIVSVTERTREIGIRIAVGARRRNILGQFTVEAILLSALGGLLGLGLGLGVAYAVSQMTPVPAAAPGWAVVVALATSSITGLGFGIYPAWRASRLDPIEALRYE